MRRISASIDDKLHEKMEKHRGEINFSKVFKDAVPGIVEKAITERQEKESLLLSEENLVQEVILSLPAALQERITLTIKGIDGLEDQHFDFLDEKAQRQS